MKQQIKNMIALPERNGVVNTRQGHIVTVALPRSYVLCNEGKAGVANMC